jgi:Spy/CpxP family protein refolding chaperone
MRGGIAVVVVSLLATVAMSQRVQVRRLGQGGQPVIGNVGIPGMYMLGTEKVQKKLELVDEQKQKLQDIAKKYREQVREAWSGWQEVPADKRQAKMTEIREKTKKLAEQARKDAEGVLLKHQLDALKELVFRSRAQYSLQNARVQQEIGLDEAQRTKLRELRNQLQERIQELNAEMLDKALEVLTPEQRKKLEDASWQSVGQGYNFGGGIVYPAVRKAN